MERKPNSRLKRASVGSTSTSPRAEATPLLTEMSTLADERYEVGSCTPSLVRGQVKPVGTWVGPDVGTGVGRRVGNGDGSKVGRVVGSGEGFGVGIGDGMLDGSDVGSAEGSGVGTNVGI